jgi:hypothetical protein
MYPLLRVGFVEQFFKFNFVSQIAVSLEKDTLPEKYGANVARLHRIFFIFVV